MYQSSYQEVVDDSSQAERENEVMAFDRAIEMLEAAELQGIPSIAAVEAQFFVHRMWVFFIEDLTDERNVFDDQLKADLISVGIWIIREIERLRQGECHSFKDIISVSKAIRDGLL